MHRHGKGQLSLEFIIQFVIVAVVIAIILGLVFTILPDDTPDIGEKTREIESIRNTCRQECLDWKTSIGVKAQQEALEYCTRRFTSDLNGNGIIRGDVEGQSYSAYCEDGIHCFNVHSCDNKGRLLDIDTCIDIMCQYYNSSEGEAMSEEQANSTIKQLYAADAAEGNRGVGTCDLRSIEEDATGATINTWYNESVAFPSNVCAGLP